MNNGCVYRPAPNKVLTDYQQRKFRHSLDRALPEIYHPHMTDTINAMVKVLTDFLYEKHAEEYKHAANPRLQAENEAKAFVAAVFGGMELSIRNGKVYATYEKPGLEKEKG